MTGSRGLGSYRVVVVAELVQALQVVVELEMQTWWNSWSS